MACYCAGLLLCFCCCCLQVNAQLLAYSQLGDEFRDIVQEYAAVKVSTAACWHGYCLPAVTNSSSKQAQMLSASAQCCRTMSMQNIDTTQEPDVCTGKSVQESTCMLCAIQYLRSDLATGYIVVT
jgi:hypothetical protein